MDETAQLIEEQKKNLPPELVRAIEETAWEPVVQKIGKDAGLNDDQVDSLEREVMLILYAFEPLENLAGNISKQVGVSEDVAKKISDSVWEMIMGPISRRAGGGAGERSQITSSTLPQIAPDLDPMIAPGEAAREIPHVEQHAPQPAPQPAPETSMTELEKDSPIVGANFVPASAPAQSPQPPKPQTTPPSPTELQPAPTQSPDAPTPEDRRYPGGVDPYREPVE